MLWTGAILYRILERVIPSPGVRAAATLWIVGTEGILWEVGNYMVDLYGLPLLLEAAVLAIPDEENEKNLLDELPRFGLLLGVAVALKLTNLVFAFAIGAVFLANLFLKSRRHAPRKLAVPFALGALAFLLPAAPHMLYLLVDDGEPPLSALQRDLPFALLPRDQHPGRPLRPSVDPGGRRVAGRVGPPSRAAERAGADVGTARLWPVSGHSWSFSRP